MLRIYLNSKVILNHYFTLQLTHFSPMFHLYAPLWKPQKTFGLFTFPASIEMENWAKIAWCVMQTNYFNDRNGHFQTFISFSFHSTYCCSVKMYMILIYDSWKYILIYYRLIDGSMLNCQIFGFTPDRMISAGVHLNKT